MRGKRTPLRLQQAQGDTRKRGVNKLRELVASEPQAEAGFPERPDYLQGQAVIAWEFWTDALRFMKLAYRPDAIALEAACVAYHEFRDAYQTLNSEGRTRMDDKGREYTNPAYARMMTASAALKTFCTEFGLTPIGRTRLTIEKPVNRAKKFEEMLSAPRKPFVGGPGRVQ